MSLQLHYTGQDYINRGLAGGTLTPGSTSAIVGGCKTGKGFAFDGTVYSALHVNTTMSMPSEFTISCFAKVDDIVGDKTIWTNGGLFGSGFQIDFNNDKIRAFVYNTTSVDYIAQTNTGFIEANKWYHIVAGIRDNKLFLYVDKVFIGETAITGTVRTDFEPIIGMRFGGGASIMDGQICNFKYYDHALSTKEINDDYKSLILHYPLNKAITDTVLDVSGFQRHITNLTDNTVTLDSKAEVYSNSLKNDGTQALMGDCDLTDLNGIPEISISFRVYKQNTDLDAILTNRTILGNGIAIFVSGTQILVDISIRNTHSYTLPLNEWVHVCVTQSATEQKLYVNGVIVSTMTASTLSGIGNYTSISNANVSGDRLSGYLNGNVQDIRFYAKALTDDDVKDLYNVRHSIDKNGNYYTYELIEGETGVGMKKNGQTNCDEIIENEDGSFSIKSNKTIKVNNIKEI